MVPEAVHGTGNRRPRSAAMSRPNRLSPCHWEVRLRAACACCASSMPGAIRRTGPGTGPFSRPGSTSSTWYPASGPKPEVKDALSPESFPIIEVDVRSPGDVNRHSYADVGAVSRLAVDHQVDLVDLFEEPFSRAAGQLLPRLPPELPVVMYSAQNLDKRWPPPYRDYERRSLQRVQGFYPCSRQAAAVLRGKGFGGLIEPLPLGYDDDVLLLRRAVVGRREDCGWPLSAGWCPKRASRDAVRVLADLHVGRGMDVESGPGRLRTSADRRDEAGGGARRGQTGWNIVLGSCPRTLAQLYRETHVVLAPSRSTATWAEQFGRMIVEGQASGCVIVGYDSGSIPEVGGDPALLVREGDVDSLAEAAALVLSDPEQFEARRRSGLALAPREDVDLRRPQAG